MTKPEKNRPNLLSFGLGASLWMPALVIPTLELQASNLFSLAIILSLLVKNNPTRIKIAPTILSITLFITWALSLAKDSNTSDGQLVFLYYICFTIPLIIAFCHSYLKAPESLINGFLMSGFIFLTANAIQYTLDIQFIESLRNSKLFIILHGINRTALLFPEPSGLGQTSALWGALIISRYINKKITTTTLSAAATLYSIVILSTMSLSSIALLFALTAISLILHFKPSPRKIIQIAAISTAVIAGTYMMLTELIGTRGESMILSAGNRFSTILAVLLYLSEGGLGVGLGNNSTITPYVIQAQQLMGIQSYIIAEGINSWLFTRIYEEGYLALTPYIMTILYLRRAHKSLKENEEIALIAAASFIIATLLAGYRGYPIMWVHLAFIVCSIYHKPAKPQAERIQHR